MRSPQFSSTRAAVLAMTLGTLLLVTGGCANTRSSVPAPSVDRAASHDLYGSPADAGTANAVRTGRYQLVPLAPTSGQRDLMQQAVSIDLPQSMHLTVRDGLAHALRDSGLRLCPHQAQAGFFSTPLPAVHRELGPTTLSDALQVLAGPAWALQVDFANRTVCFNRRATPRPVIAGPSDARRDAADRAATHS